MTPTPKINLHDALAIAIKAIRKSRNLTQEDFGLVSSRTYLSTLERGLKSPTLDKLDEIARVMTVHPASLILLAYSILSSNGMPEADTVDTVCQETKILLRQLVNATDSPIAR
ncbi:MAG: helix-turn-helix transcriptional regulator [Dechloromonas sp.]|nr:helix-turn-helix transcriptional regulator [Dechloromonas sp.]